MLGLESEYFLIYFMLNKILIQTILVIVKQI